MRELEAAQQMTDPVRQTCVTCNHHWRSTYFYLCSRVKEVWLTEWLALSSKSCFALRRHPAATLFNLYGYTTFIYCGFSLCRIIITWSYKWMWNFLLSYFPSASSSLFILWSAPQQFYRHCNIQRTVLCGAEQIFTAVFYSSYCLPDHRRSYVCSAFLSLPAWLYSCL